MTATVFAPDSAQTLVDLECSAARVAAVLAARGVRPGSRVLFKADNSAAWVTVFLGLAHAGASIVLVDHQDKADETTRIQQLTRAALSIVDDDSVPPRDGEIVYLYELLAAAAARPAPDLRGPLDLDTWRARPDGLIMWSSGSTGVPKGVVKTGARFLENLERNAEQIGHRPDDVLLPLLPFSHQYGLSMVMIAWLVRCSLVIAPYRRADRALRMAAQTGATVLDATPSTYRSIVNIVNRRPDPMADLRTVRLFCSGAAPLDAALVDRYVGMCGKPLLDSYGSTELGNVAFATEDNPVATGRPVRGMGVRIVDDEGVVLSADEIGEIEVDSPDLMEGYLDADGEIVPAARGWRRTGDFGKLDKDGNLFVIGRKLAVHRNGYTLYPELIEARVAGQAACSTKVIAVPDDRRGSSLVFFVEDESGADAAHWRERICAVLPAYEQPNRVVVLERLPLNRNGKPDRKALEKLAVTA
ncbi:long-chain-fatty-acid--CoA ligase [Actinoplanes cyaneus]|uniref:Long-chain-fatty-acid--CoA ligase n=1 Tax=Actinoplanes cyaneus TaxID=52696 RepID=A0A919MAU2_9ACTN|nr:class I adenylate-forming enzyme family protein [Actinoplanes cyaneus]MCW2142386.1 Acyl-CoA synthetase (AMP-forming)/AMP-acid ligase II [Actinoplanes cyaneus]GID70883.1 long-chain-fatty-acid--CoA ligase [Actinoplanes cyaneus]